MSIKNENLYKQTWRTKHKTKDQYHNKDKDLDLAKIKFHQKDAHAAHITDNFRFSQNSHRKKHKTQELWLPRNLPEFLGGDILPFIAQLCLFPVDVCLPDVGLDKNIQQLYPVPPKGWCLKIFKCQNIPRNMVGRCW